MKLAEALQLRTGLQKRINQLSSRLCNNATVQEGEKPAEDPAALMEEYEDCVAQLEGLIARINRTNSETRTESGTLTELLARRDCLKLRLQTLSGLRQQSDPPGHPFGDPDSKHHTSARVPEKGGCAFPPAAGGGQRHPVRQLVHRAFVKTPSILSDALSFKRTERGAFPQGKSPSS